jgi:hypothetical protein
MSKKSKTEKVLAEAAQRARAAARDEINNAVAEAEKARVERDAAAAAPKPKTIEEEIASLPYASPERTLLVFKKYWGDGNGGAAPPTPGA